MDLYFAQSINCSVFDLNRKTRFESLDVHPKEKALVVNYTLEAQLLGELGDPMLNERKDYQKM